jgi:hypothetical protein
MATEKDLEKKLCLKYCTYFKPNKNNELECMGYYVIKKLLKKGQKIIFTNTKKTISRKTVEMFKKRMCIYCPFYKNDCDFLQQKYASHPCGGFILLGKLLELNLISFDDIVKNIERL